MRKIRLISTGKLVCFWLNSACIWFVLDLNSSLKYNLDGAWGLHFTTVCTTPLASHLARATDLLAAWPWRKLSVPSSDRKPMILRNRILLVNNGTQWVRRATAFEFEDEETVYMININSVCAIWAILVFCNSFLNDQTLLLQGLWT